VIQVTSSYPSEGKSTTISNLAISFATAGRRVLLIDADLRRPTQNDVHQLTRDRGLTQLLQDRLPVVQVVRPSQVEGLDIMTAGPEVSNPAELLSSPRLKELLDEARQTYDLILLDSPPLLAVADAAIVGAFADGIILVNKPTTTRRHEIVKSMELLRSLGTSVLGIIVNDVSREDRMEGYGYGYGYGYRYGYGYGGKSNGQQATERSGAVSRSAEIGQGQPAVAFRTNGKPVHGLTGERPAE
jgi:capsular exopolysaccharide synthesis family protein